MFYQRNEDEIRKPPTVIFSAVEGVLLNTLPLYGAMEKMLLGENRSAAVPNLQFNEQGAASSIFRREFLRRLSATECEDLTYPHTRPLLRALQLMNVPIYIYSELEQRLLRELLRHCGIDAYISGSIGGDDVEDAPNSNFLVGKLLTEHPAEQQLLFGSRIEDIQTAQIYQMTSVWFPSSSWRELPRQEDKVMPDYTWEKDDFGLFRLLQLLG